MSWLTMINHDQPFLSHCFIQDVKLPEGHPKDRCPKFPLLGWLIEGLETSSLAPGNDDRWHTSHRPKPIFTKPGHYCINHSSPLSIILNHYWSVLTTKKQCAITRGSHPKFTNPLNPEPSFSPTNNFQALSTFEVEHGFAQALRPKKHRKDVGKLS